MRRNQVFNDSIKYWCDRNKKWKMAVKKQEMSLKKTNGVRLKKEENITQG